MLHIILFVLTFVIGSLLIFISNPAFSFVLYEAVYFFYPNNRWWGEGLPNLSYSFFTVLLMIFSIVIYGKSASKNKLFNAPQMKWICLLIISFAFSSLYAPFLDHHYQVLRDLITLVIVISIAYKLIDDVTKLDYVIMGYIYGAAYISFYIFQTGRGNTGRVEGIGTVDAPDANGIASVLGPSLVLCLYYFWQSDKLIKKVIFAFAGIFVANALILINSRGAFLGVMASLVYFMYYMYTSPIQRPYQKLTIILIMLVGLGGAIRLADESFLTRIQSIVTTKVDKESESGATRTVFWKSAWEMTKDYPFGTGANGFQYYAPYYIPENVHTGNSRNRAVHSTWFEVLSEVGYLGFFFFCMMLFSCFRTSSKCKKSLKNNNEIDHYFRILALEAALICFIVTMTFLNRFKAEILYWLILYTMCAYNIHVVQKTDKIKQ
jgi:hypothetical protein